MDKNKGEAGSTNNAAQDQAPDESLGLNDAVSALLARKGISPSKDAAASAAEPEGEANANAHSQTQTETDASSAEAESKEGSEAEEGAEGTEETGVDPDEGDEPEWFQRRIDKMTARMKTAEERAQKLEDELKAIKAGGTKPANQDPGVDPEVAPLLKRVTELKQEVNTATQLRAMLAKDPDSVAEIIRKVRPDLANYEPETLRDYLNDYIGDAKSALGVAEGQVTERRKVTEAKREERRGQVIQLTQDQYPWVKDTADPRTQRFQQLLDDPVVRSSPDAPFFIAAGIEKLQAIEARQRTGGKPAAAQAAEARPRVRPPASGRAAPARTEAKDPVAEARERLKSGDGNAAKAYARAAMSAAMSE